MAVVEDLRHKPNLNPCRRQQHLQWLHTVLQCFDGYTRQTVGSKGSTFALGLSGQRQPQAAAAAATPICPCLQQEHCMSPFMPPHTPPQHPPVGRSKFPCTCHCTRQPPAARTGRACHTSQAPWTPGWTEGGRGCTCNARYEGSESLLEAHATSLMTYTLMRSVSASWA